MRLNLSRGIEGETQIVLRRLALLDTLVVGLFDGLALVEPLLSHFPVLALYVSPRRQAERRRRGLGLVGDAVAHLIPFALVLFEHLALLFGQPRLLSRNAFDGLLLRAPITLILLLVLREQRLALLREALFHPFLGLLAQMVIGVAGHGLSL